MNKLAIALYASLLLLLFGKDCCAQLDFSISPANTSVNSGVSISYSGMLTNTSSSELFLNGYSLAPLNPSLIFDDSDFFVNVPLSLNPGETWSGEIFDILVELGATPDTYNGFFTFLGGIQVSDLDDLSGQGFAITVIEPSVAPEPGSGTFVVLTMIPISLVALNRRTSGRHAKC